MDNMLNGRNLSGFSIFADSRFSVEVEALRDAIAEFGVSLPEVNGATGDVFRFADGCESCGGRRFSLSSVEAEHGMTVILDGETQELRISAIEALVRDIREHGTLPLNSSRYAWGELAAADLRLDSKECEVLAKGVVLHKLCYTRNDGLPVKSWVVVARPEHSEIAVQTAPWGTVRTVGEHVKFAQTRGKNVIAATNADFFHLAAGTLTPYGAQIVDGVVVYEPHTRERYGNLWFGVTDQGMPVIGDKDDYFNTYQNHLKQAVGGGVLLMKDGRIVLETCDNYGPRTWIGYAPDGTVALGIADGRKAEWSKGISLAEQIQIFLDLQIGITDAINLDGGGSTAMALCDETGTPRIINSVCVDPERPVADTVMVIRK